MFAKNMIALAMFTVILAFAIAGLVKGAWAYEYYVPTYDEYYEFINEHSEDSYTVYRRDHSGQAQMYCYAALEVPHSFVHDMLYKGSRYLRVNSSSGPLYINVDIHPNAIRIYFWDDSLTTGHIHIQRDSYMASVNEEWITDDDIRNLLNIIVNGTIWNVCEPGGSYD
jgi:hypothetical protein